MIKAHQKRLPDDTAPTGARERFTRLRIQELSAAKPLINFSFAFLDAENAGLTWRERHESVSGIEETLPDLVKLGR
jgi:hypothetical protein